MPTYEYQCQKCRKRHEAFQSITAKPLTTCPLPAPMNAGQAGQSRGRRARCGGRLKRLLGSGSGFLFKGGGFYITDYRSKSYHDAKKREESSSKASPKAASSDKS